MAHRAARACHDDPLPTTPVRLTRHILGPEADPLKSTASVHDASRRDVVLDVKEMVKFVAMGEVDRKGNYDTVGHDPERATIGPVGAPRVDCRDQPLDVIWKQDVVMLGVGDVTAPGLPDAKLRLA